MRKVLMTLAVATAFGLAGCGKSVSEATAEAPAAPAPKKSMARMAPLYAGQEQVQSIESASVTAAPGGGVDLKASATTATPGWTQVGFLPRIYPATPPDGIYEIDVVAQGPGTAGAATPVKAEGGWDKYKDGRVKGVKFISKTNEIVAMLPAGSGAAAGK